ncbi:class II D-tagatose-bisphosphate aldolase non-catalytic subunit [Pectinatus cerevisiiphilus]|uniref:Tagatose-1,6-bisphosphate aldolase non-catalytic subunit AgaZ/GatZ n=1 Tax=Pectinatus cerevisiiphilus TaxID=86956 RepID=A0A4R3KDA7_9FIRM|nr:class II D-tagatose-bisphosphate aldolase, non-catalytic subunit [Pectinatus cerevisiiphilus]TCS81020.1 tagatose-1,6-bisphosphate aldolase non-catalytic subunit AgaZ/GatZ [Pectinatus cerevisiiphilus]
MDKITLNEVVQKMLAFNGNNKASMLGIGPMSINLIKASMILAKEKDFPLMFIASRNQVDADELGGGYVCNWNQERFADAIKKVAKEINYDGLYFLCRDHGGPWQRDNERNAHLPEKEAMALGKKSYLIDLISKFNLLHIDPTKDPYTIGKVINMDVNINRTVELIEYAEKERIVRGLPAISYEVGTEETNGGLTSSENYEKFIKKLIARLDEKKLPHPAFIVGNTGTLTRLTKNVGHVDSASCKELSAIAKKYGVGLKEHNGDYLDDAVLLEHPALGVTAMNVAPEFGTVETQAYLKLTEVEKRLAAQRILKKPSKLGQVLRQEAVKSGRWKKWMVNGKDTLSPEEIFRDKKLTLLITEISGHYTFNNDRVKQETTILYENLATSGIDGEKYVIYKIKNSIDRYVECFNLKGLTTKLKKR